MTDGKMKTGYRNAVNFHDLIVIKQSIDLSEIEGFVEYKAQTLINGVKYTNYSLVPDTSMITLAERQMIMRQVTQDLLLDLLALALEKK